MHRIPRIALALTIGFSFSAVSLSAGDSVEPRAREVLEQSSTALGAQERARFVVRDSIDIIDATGQKIQHEHNRTIEVERPNRFRSSAQGDLMKAQAWYDGESASILLPGKNVWGKIEHEGDIDSMLLHASEVLGMQFPAADLASNDFAALILENAKSLRYLGIHLALGTDCHHLAFSNDGIDGQIWLRTDDAATIQKLVIDYKSLPGEPQYQLEVLSIEYPESYPEGHFDFAPPEGAERVDLLPIAQAVAATQE